MKAAPPVSSAFLVPCMRRIRWVLLALLLLGPRGVQAQSVRFAVIGDYGADSTPELNVSALVKSWNPDFVITVGDNNYDTGSAAKIDTNIGKYYHDFIYNYSGSYGAGSSSPRFLPSLGNHDWGNAYPNPTGAAPYIAYFDLPGNERYYDFQMDPVHLFAVDSDANEPDGNSDSSVQASWLRAALGSSTAPWKLVYFHHPPYSSGQHGSSAYMRWPFSSWGASAVLSGHDHDYERLSVNGLPYFVVGTGGKSLYGFVSVLPESQFRYNADYGAMLVDATADSISFQFYNRAAVLIDTYTLTAAVPTSIPTPTPTRTLTRTPTRTVTPNATSTPTPTPTTAAVAAPSNLTAQSVSSSQINLAWSDNSGNETGFKIERSTNGTAFAQIALVGANVRTYSNTGLTRGTRYWFRVRAFNASVDSAFSNTASARTKQK
jgi:tartrate-resistant acid phosphatase type 5